MERPLLMTTDNVKAILDKRKTQARIVIKPPTDMKKSEFDMERGWADLSISPKLHVPIKLKSEPDWSDDRWWRIYSPYQVGDRLWLRETFQIFDMVAPMHIHYKADYPRDTVLWKPSIHMPRWASRITLEITERLEVLQAPAHTADDYNPRWARVAPKWSSHIILPDDLIWHWDWDFIMC